MSSSRLRAQDLAVYLVTNRECLGDRALVPVVAEAIAGGVTFVQLREKDATTREQIALGARLLEVCRAAGVPFVVNDRVDVAHYLGADGVHLGQSDIPYAYARRVLGKDAIIGVTTPTPEAAQEAERAGADYIGIGPVYATRTKRNAGPPIGLERLASVAASVAIPAVAIGGLTLENVADAIQSGVEGAAVVTAILAHSDPRAASRALAQEITRAGSGP